jgi:formylmethanofuran dehydrogenase subunit E
MKIKERRILKMMSISEVLELVKEYYEEEKKTIRIPHYYKRNGKMLRRSYDDYIETERYIELNHILNSEEARVFQCADCGEMVGYFELETWVCDFEDNKYICACCYETAMGDDL